MENAIKVVVVIVMYNPKTADVENVRRLSAICDVIAVDNSLIPTDYNLMGGRVLYIFNGSNKGIAEAQNTALRRAIELGKYTHVVFLDQDSRVDDTYPNSIANEFCFVDDGHLAILGPSVFHIDDGTEYCSVVHHYETTDSGFSQRPHVISSGSCVSIFAIERVGMFDSRLFIDYVDFEWCWRAISKGYHCGITNKLTIYHKVGQRELSIGKYKVIISAPGRYYYQYRNFLWLVRRKYVPLPWKLATGTKFLIRLMYLPLVVENGSKYLHNMLNGIKAGIKCQK